MTSRGWTLAAGPKRKHGSQKGTVTNPPHRHGNLPHDVNAARRQEGATSSSTGHQHLPHIRNGWWQVPARRWLRRVGPVGASPGSGGPVLHSRVSPASEVRVLRATLREWLGPLPFLFLGQRALHRGHEPCVHAYEFQTRPRPFSGVRGAGFLGILRAFVHSGSRAPWRLPVAAASRNRTFSRR
jgi:hypothetical protein